MTAQQVPDGVREESIGAATEGSEFHELDVRPLLGAPFGRPENPVGEGPLGEEVHIIQKDVFVPDQVIRDDIGLQRSNHVAYLMLDERVGVIRPSGQHDDKVPFLTVCKDAAADAGHPEFTDILLTKRLTESFPDGFFGNSQSG